MLFAAPTMTEAWSSLRPASPPMIARHTSVPSGYFTTAYSRVVWEGTAAKRASAPAGMDECPIKTSTSRLRRPAPPRPRRTSRLCTRHRSPAARRASGPSGRGDDLRQSPGVLPAVRAAYDQAGVGPEDLDVVELHDASAAGEMLVYERLGLCRPGEACRLVRET